MTHKGSEEQHAKTLCFSNFEDAVPGQEKRRLFAAQLRQNQQARLLVLQVSKFYAVFRREENPPRPELIISC